MTLVTTVVARLLGSGPEEEEVLQNTGGLLFVHLLAYLFAYLFVPSYQAFQASNQLFRASRSAFWAAAQRG